MDVRDNTIFATATILAVALGSLALGNLSVQTGGGMRVLGERHVLCLVRGYCLAVTGIFITATSIKAVSVRG